MRRPRGREREESNGESQESRASRSSRQPEVALDQSGSHEFSEFSSARNPPLPPNLKKSVLVAYLCYFVGGFFGLHLFYLGRDNHAFVTLTTFGRFGFVLLDFFFIPSYVAEANEDLDKQFQWFKRTRRASGRCWPCCCSFSCLGTISLQLGTAFTYLAMVKNCVDNDWEYYPYVMVVLEPLAPVVASVLVGRIGITTVPLAPVYFVTLASYLVFKFLEATEYDLMIILASVAAVCFYGTYRQPLQRSTARRVSSKHFCKRFLAVSFGVLVYSAVWTGVILENAEITNEDGQNIKLIDALRNFYNSPAWEQMMTTIGELWDELTRKHDPNDDSGGGRWERFKRRVMDLADVDGEKRAILDLGLVSTATDQEIKSTYRKLALKYHPDRNKGNEKEAGEKFMKIQEAYDTLVNLRKLRKTKKASADPKST